MIDQWHTLVEKRDISGLETLIADEAVLHSPVVFKPLAGKPIVKMYLTAAFHTFLNDTFQYVREVKSGQHAVLEFTVEIDGIFVNGVDMITWNDEGKIIDFKVMIRPLKGVNLIHQKMAALLEKAPK